MRPNVDRSQLLTAVAAVGLVVLVFLLPDLSGRSGTDNRTVEAFRGRIEAIRQPLDDADPATPPVPIAEVRALDGPRVGQLLEAYMSGAGGSQLVADYRVGEEVLVTITAGPAGSEPFVAVSDRWRLPALQGLGLVFAAAVVLVGGWHGVRALVALGLTIAVLLKVLIPLIVSGVPPLPLAVVSASLVTIGTIVLTEGWKRSSLAAILGTTGALALTGLFAAAATSVMGFTYAAGSDLAFVTTAGGEGLDLRGVLLAAFILGAVGVLDDVTVTQAVLVDELAAADLRGAALVRSGMRIGRSHIAATINTLFLAYVGGGLPLLVALLLSRLPAAVVFNDEVIATEIVRTIVGSLGILAAVPLTTMIAAAMAPAAGHAGDRAGHRQAGAVAVAGGVIAALLVATAVLPLTGGPRRALVPDRFDPSRVPTASPGSAATASAPASGPASPEPSGGASPGGPALAEQDEPVPIVLDGADAGTITVRNWTVSPASASDANATVSVLVRYEASGSFELSRGEWSVLLGDGSQFPLVPDGGLTALDRSLAPGESLEVTLSGRFATTDEPAFIVYFDVPTASFVLAVAIDP